MSNRIATERQELAGMVEAALGELGAFVTGDVAKARPLPGMVAVFIEPPDIDYPAWGDKPECTWRLDLLAGTPATQAGAFDPITKAIGLLAEAGLNIATARPVTFSLAGAGTLASYQITLNPLDIQEE
ncbi:MAG: hypothetical protein E6160_04920 [Bifidobacterium bifidum]|nr:hypothetical protein [Bifidobacterium bifidum]MDU5899582.1 hypothetical protein [Bifidobacterium sp.]